jgi:4-amino-4-deoxy-L-arabinose transferase-like glycosyltransferase
MRNCNKCIFARRKATRYKCHPQNFILAATAISVLHARDCRQVDNRLLTYVSVRRFSVLPAAVLVAVLYFADLTGMGVVGPDEPRYADVGRAMAQSGDWVTPRLWGEPWFEKPALLYWMTAAGFRLGLGPDLAPRLPVALLSVLFLAFFWWRLKLEWDARTAFFATAMLAASAGWLTYSHIAVTDLPLAAFFSAAVLLSLPWLMRGDRSTLLAAAGCLGSAALTKGLVPLVLFLPVLAFGRKRLRDWFRPAPLLAFSVCAFPWYILCTIRNGREFLRVFFIQQQLSRFASAALQHVQPWWFYAPMLLVLLYPWFPLLFFPSLAFPRDFRRDPRVRALAGVVIFGFVFFSAAVNKLPGYLVPLMPALFALLGIGLARTPRPAVAITLCVALLGLLPAISEVAPHMLAAHGLFAAKGLATSAIWLVPAALAGFVCARFKPRLAPFLAGAAFLWFQLATFPRFDTLASARPLWLQRHPQCAPGVSRDLLYGLYYYSGGRIPPCPVPDEGAKQIVR